MNSNTTLQGFVSPVLRNPAWRLALLCAVIGALAIPLFADLAELGATDSLHAHTVWIPWVSLILVLNRWRDLDMACQPAWRLAAVPAVVGAVLLFWPGGRATADPAADLVPHAVGLAILWVAAHLAVLGATNTRILAFPLAFLLFMAPISRGMELLISDGLRNACVHVTSVLLNLSGLEFERRGTEFMLSTITLDVAPECSGIRSTWVLLMLTLVLAHLTLGSGWRSFILVAAVLPIGIVRNALRIAIISWLCVAQGPQMIHNPIHVRGGPVFFLISLVPLALVWWMLRARGNRVRAAGAVSS